VEARPSQLNKFIFETVASINDYDGSKLKPEQTYWKEEKSTSKKLELKLMHRGLYWL
jgi:glucan biosynthesis protein